MTKLVNQVMVIHTIMSIAEGFAFAEKAGLDLKTTWDVTSAGAASSHSLKVLGQKILAGDFKPAFMVDLQLKDLRLVMEIAEQLQQPLPGTALAKELLSVLKAQGRGRDGTQALVDVIRQLGKS
jgi:3-hydroxyisobutyrate dehydrogenase